MKTRNDRNTFRRKTRETKAPGHTYQVTVEYGMEYLEGNRQPYFVIPGHDLVGGGGCMRDEIALTFPELADLIPWHLTDQDGTPMHYLANGMYWYDHPDGDDYRKTEPFAYFKSTIVFGALEDDEEMWTRTASLGRAAVETWIAGRLGRLRDAFRAVMKKHGVQM